MSEFLKLVSPDEALALLLANLDPRAHTDEQVGVAEALHRTTSRDILAPHALPEFSRSTVDGYALLARDTFGASGSQPSYLSLIGEVVMGTTPAFAISSSRCATIHTGGMVPAGADAVIMLEHTQAINNMDPGGGASGEIEILRSVAPGENIIMAGEDVAAGEVVLQTGRLIRAQEIGGLAALGVTSVHVQPKPRVGIISTGDEVVADLASPRLGQVRDVNGPVLTVLVTDQG